MTLVVLGSLPMILKKPHIGIVMWCWMSYMNPHRLAWGFAYDMPFAAMIAVAVLASLITASKEIKFFPVTPITVLLVLFVGWMAVATVFALYPDNAWMMYGRVFKIILMTFVTMMIMVDKNRIGMLVWAIVVSLGFFGIKGGVYTILTGGSGHVFGPPGSFFADNNALALALTMLIPLVNYLRLMAVNIWMRRALLFSMVLIVVSVIGSQSRGAFVGGIAMLFYMWIKSKSKVVTGAVAIVLVVSIYTFTPQNWQERMATIQQYEQDASAMGRVNAWWQAYYVAKDRLTGGGYAQWTPETFALYAPDPTDVHDAHSIYFEVLGENGFIALFLFLAIGTLSLRTANWNIKKTANIEELKWANSLSRMVFVSIIAYATGGAFLGMAYFDLYYHLIAILLLTQQVIKDQLNQAGSDSSVGKSSPIKPPFREFVRSARE